MKHTNNLFGFKLKTIALVVFGLLFLASILYVFTQTSSVAEASFNNHNTSIRGSNNFNNSIRSHNSSKNARSSFGNSTRKPSNSHRTSNSGSASFGNSNTSYNYNKTEVTTNINYIDGQNRCGSFGNSCNSNSRFGNSDRYYNCNPGYRSSFGNSRNYGRCDRNSNGKIGFFLFGGFFLNRNF